MAGPRLTAPAAKQLVRSISTTPSPAVPKSTTLLTSSKTTAPLMRKYAELLKERNIDSEGSQHPRSLYTRSANRPHPAPKRMRLMQTFTTSAPRTAERKRSTMDFAVLPGASSLEGEAMDPYAHIRVPLLPDNFMAHNAPEALDEPSPMPEINIVAANPELVSVSALTEVEGMTMDGVELKFAHSESAPESEPSMITNMWQGLMADVFGDGKKKMSI
jgi:hypothetical protein